MVERRAVSRNGSALVERKKPVLALFGMDELDMQKMFCPSLSLPFSLSLSLSLSLSHTHTHTHLSLFLSASAGPSYLVCLIQLQLTLSLFLIVSLSHFSICHSLSPILSHTFSLSLSPSLPRLVLLILFA